MTDVLTPMLTNPWIMLPPLTLPLEVDQVQSTRLLTIQIQPTSSPMIGIQLSNPREFGTLI